MTEEQLADAVMRQEYKKYEKIMFDFSYLDNADALDDQIQNNVDLIELDENFKESYQDIIVRFFDLFESIYTYYDDLKRFIENVHQEHFIDHTIETILLNSEGKCLMLEIFYLYGVMLLLMDRLIPSIARERLVICYSRYIGQNASDLYSKVVKLVKGTGYTYDKETRKEHLPKNYPAEYFNRFFIEKKLIEQLVNQMRDDEVYKRLSAYPDPEHRSAALFDQAQIMFVLLNFCPRILEKEDARMREITDRHFPDNWIIPIF